MDKQQQILTMCHLQYHIRDQRKPDYPKLVVYLPILPPEGYTLPVQSTCPPYLHILLVALIVRITS